MNKIVSIVLAGSIALSAVAASTTGVGAHDRRWQYPPHYYPPPAYNPGPAIVAGAIFGLALGALAESEPVYAPPPPPAYYYPPPPYYYYYYPPRQPYPYGYYYFGP